MSDKPKMYRCDTKKEFTNNKSVYTSYSNNTYTNNLSVYDINEVRKKIDALFNSPNFIYRTKVNIIIDNKAITKKVIGLHNNNLVTIDNEHIPINIIQDIYK